MELSRLFFDGTEEEYRGAEGVSYSFLKTIVDKGPRALIEPMPKIENNGVILGSIVDKMLTEDDYNPLNEFKVLEEPLDLYGTTHIPKILKFLKDTPEISLNRDDDVVLQRIYDILEIKRAPKLDDSFWNQVLIIQQMHEGQKFISREELDLAYTMYNTFINHEFTSSIFLEDDNIEVINQGKYFFEYEEVLVKVMLDKIRVDHSNKVIYLHDIKTGSGQFMKQFFDLKYYLQGGLYYFAVQDLVNKYCPDYTIAPYFEFDFISRESPSIPIRYQMDLDFIKQAQNGYTNVLGIKTKGILELITEYKWYLDNQIFDVTKELKEAFGVVKINTPRTL